MASRRRWLSSSSSAIVPEIAPVEDHSGATLLSNDDGVSAFYRAKGHRAPHNVYASTPDLYAAGAEAGDHSPPPPALFKFGPPAPGQPNAGADVPMGQYADAAWRLVQAASGFPDSDGAEEWGKRAVSAARAALYPWRKNQPAPRSSPRAR